MKIIKREMVSVTAEEMKKIGEVMDLCEIIVKETCDKELEKLAIHICDALASLQADYIDEVVAV